MKRERAESHEAHLATVKRIMDLTAKGLDSSAICERAGISMRRLQDIRYEARKKAREVLA